MIARVKQGLIFIFGKYKKKWDIEVRDILSQEEFQIFDQMSDYDKIHSYRLYRLVSKDKVLGSDKLYKKLALLHDCGKYHASLYRRVKKVLIGEKSLENHSELSYEKLKGINLELALLAKKHHTPPEDEKMKKFQKLDDK